MSENIQRSKGVPQNYKSDRGGVPSQPGPFIGTVMSNVDSTRSGRLRVYISDLGGDDPDDSDPDDNDDPDDDGDDDDDGGESSNISTTSETSHAPSRHTTRTKSVHLSDVAKKGKYRLHAIRKALVQPPKFDHCGKADKDVNELLAIVHNWLLMGTYPDEDWVTIACT